MTVEPAAAERSALHSTGRPEGTGERPVDLSEPIAIVGIGLRFPGDNKTLDGFEEFLREGRTGIRPPTDDRWDTEAFTSIDPEDRGKIRAAGCGFLDDIDQFDAPFFGVSPLEAQFTDPQQRLLLETVWEALENANINPAGLRHGDGGVYIGASAIDYALEMDTLDYELCDGHLASGISLFPMSGRVSYFLGWRGPSLTLDTACASSLTAVHLAVEGLRRRECGIAIAGAVSCIHHPKILVIFTHGKMLAPDGRCKTFDEDADGYVRAEGSGALVLKRLSDALRDGDTVHALITGTAIGQDGESAGLSVPNGTAQEQVMRLAITNAGIEPSDIQCVEAHGTGTALGDPIEMGAISDVFRGSHTKDNPVRVASLKTNIGHMEPVAGIGSVVKMVLQIRSGTYFPHLNMTNPSGRIPWDRIPVTVPTECSPWVAPKRRGLINSFGFAGSIASAVIEEPPVPVPTAGSGAPSGAGQVFTVSAKSKKSLTMQIERYQALLAQNPEMSVEDICYTANVGRSHFPMRVAGTVRDRGELVTLLDKQLAQVEKGGRGNDIRKAAFLFAGQATQYPGMGKALYRDYPVFRSCVDECDRLFTPYLGRSVRALMLGEASDGEQLDQTGHTQPALFTLEYSLAKLWLSWGVRPNVLIGHSIGEVVAAAVAGLFDLPDAVKLVAARARVMQSASKPGGMVAVGASVDDVRDLVAEYGDLSIAAVNSPKQCVISGGRDSLDAVAETLRGRGLQVTRLAVSHAFHSPLMAEVAEEFRGELAGITFHEPSLTLISNLTGAVARPAEISNADYWVRHIREAVNFEAGMQAIERRGKHVFIEIGPSNALSALAKQCVSAGDHRWLTSLHATDLEGSVILDAVAQVYNSGMAVSWTGFHAGRERRRVELPTYAFDRKPYWLPQKRKRHGLAGATGQVISHHPLLGSEVSTPEQLAAGEREFAARVTATNPAYLADHVVMGRVVFPGAAYLEMLLALQDAVYGDTRRPVLNMRVLQPLFLDEEETEVRTRLKPGPDGVPVAEIFSRPGGKDAAPDRSHITAMLGPVETADILSDAGQALCAMELENAECEQTLTADEVYDAYATGGLPYGPQFRRMLEVSRFSNGLAVGDLRAGSAGAVEHVPPSILDSCTHAFAAVGNDGNNYLPVRYTRYRAFKKPKSDQLRVLLRIDPARQSDVDISIDMVAYEEDAVVFELRGLGMKRVADSSGKRSLVNDLRWLKRALLPAAVDTTPRRVLAVNHSDTLAVHLGEQARACGVAVSYAADAEQAEQILHTEQITDVAWCWRPTPGGVEPDLATLRAECEANYRSLVDLLGVLDREGFGRDQRLWLVTQRAQTMPGDDAAPVPSAASSMWGFGHSLLNERPAYRATMVDLSAGPDCRLLFDEMRARGGGEFQVAFRHGQRHVRRLIPADPSGGQELGNEELVIREYGQFSGIAMAPIDDVEPKGDEVVVAVHAAGLNFKDVLNALGLLKEFGEQPLGFEASGTVVAVGPEATHAVGDAVVVNYLGCMKRRMIVPSPLAVAKPANVSFTDAAALAAAYVPAYYALHTLGGMKAGDKVLIHAAAGGVGQAAVQLALAAGAEVFATASPHKWPLLRAQGVKHLMHSRTTEFTDEILRITGGTGVDIVLNSLNKDFIPAGFRALAQGGRFIEMGKVGVWTPEQVAEKRPDATYHNFDLSELPWDTAVQVTSEMLNIVIGRVATGELAPVPTTAYSLDEVDEAFGVLSRGGNVGKLVIRFVDDEAPAPRDVTVDADHTYVVTGGLGGLGLVTAQQLVDRGARHIALIGRRAAPSEDVAPMLAKLRERAEVTILRGDIADPADMDRIVAALRERPVGGVVHAAGSLADAPVGSQTWSTIDAVFGPKVYGTWLLHEASRSWPQLQFFVGYSSAAPVVGAPGQANYAAANAYLDNLCRWRAAQGLPGLSINWGPWGEVGMSAKVSEQVLTRWREEGIVLITPTVGMRAFSSLLGSPMAQAVVGEGDWAKFAAAKPVVNAIYQKLMAAGGGGIASAGLDLDALLSASESDRMAAIDEFIREKVAQVLHFDDANAVDSTTEFVRLGLDSLVAVELKNSLEAAFRLPLPGSIALDYPSAELLAEFLSQQLVGEPVG